MADSGIEGNLSTSGIPVSDLLDCLQLKVESGHRLLATINLEEIGDVTVQSHGVATSWEVTNFKASRTRRISAEFLPTVNG